jgi:hypothetical protein
MEIYLTNINHTSLNNKDKKGIEQIKRLAQ